MRHDFLDRFARLDSAVHRLPAGLKLGATLVLLAAVAAAPGSWTALFLAVAVALTVAAAASRVPVRFLLRRLLLLEPFALGVALLALLQPGGVRVFVTLVVKSTLCLFAVILLANTTPFAEVLRVLRQVGVPRLLITLLALMYRYVFVVVDELERLQRARASRVLRPGTARRWGVIASTAGALFVRSSERAERVYAAMCARGWRA